MFNFVIGGLNAAGWVSFYIFSGGINEPTETTALRIFTILGFVICSIVASLVSFHCTQVFDSFLLNAGHNILTTAMASAPLILAIMPEQRISGQDPAGFKQVLISIILYLIAYFFYFATCIWPTYSMGGGEGLRNLMFLFGKFVIISIIIYVASSYPTIDVGQAAFAYGLITSAPMSIILAIRSKITD